MLSDAAPVPSEPEPEPESLSELLAVSVEADVDSIAVGCETGASVVTPLAMSLSVDKGDTGG